MVIHQYHFKDNKMNYIERLQDERKELDTRIRSLDSALKLRKIPANDAEIALLHSQLNIMMQYLAILDIRLKECAKKYNYLTPEGKKARIVCNDMEAALPVVVLILQDDGTEVVERLTKDLRYMVTATHIYLTKVGDEK